MKFLSTSNNHHLLFQLITTISFFLFLLLSQSGLLVQSGDVLDIFEEDVEVDNVEGPATAVLDLEPQKPRSSDVKVEAKAEAEQEKPRENIESGSDFENRQNEDRSAQLGGRSWWSFKGDQDSGLNFHSLITKRGFRLIEYSVETEDGYQLALHRVVPIEGYSESNYTSGRKPILLAHDIIGSSANWFVNSPDLLPKGAGGGENGTSASNGTDSATTEATSTGGDGGGGGGGGNGTMAPICGDNLGFCLILSGKWDVWALNFRGNAYSRRSKNFSTWNPSFWAFSQDQFAAYDIPANIKYVQDITGQKKVAFVGHEISAAAMLGLLSEHTEFTPETVDPVVLMAPSVYLANAKSLLHFLQPYGAVALAAFPHEFQLQKLLSLLGLSACKGEASLLSSGCHSAIENLYGETGHFNATRFATITQFWPTSTSADAIAHLAQIYLSNEFKHYKKTFSFGGSSDPKAGMEYPLEQIHPKMRILIMTGATDAFVDPRDAHRLIGRLHLALPHQITTFEVQNETWNHLDFVFGEDAGPLVYDPLMYFLENGELGPYKPGNSSRWVVDGNSTGGEFVVLTTEAANGSTEALGSSGGGGGWGLGSVFG